MWIGHIVRREDYNSIKEALSGKLKERKHRHQQSDNFN